MEREEISLQAEYEGRVRAALALRDIRAFRDALEQLKKASIAQPDGAQAALLLGLTYEDLGQHRAAKQAFDRALELDPDSRETRLALGTYLLRHEKYNEAARCLRPLADTRDTSGVLAYAKALAGGRGGAKRATEYLESALRRDPDNTRVAQELFSYYLQEDDADSAKSVVEKIAAGTPPSMEAWRFINESIKSGQFEETLRWAERMQRFDTDSFGGGLVAVAAKLAGRMDQVVAAARLQTKREPSNWLFWARLASALHIQGSARKAKAAAQKAIELAVAQDVPAPDLKELRFLLADIAEA